MHQYHPTRFVAGVLFFIIGLAFFLESLSVWQVRAVDVWPLFLIAFGTAVLLGRVRRTKVEEDRSGQLAVAEERVRIARELHDIVAHGVSLMTIQIAAARRVQKNQPEAAEQSLQAAEETGRQSLAQLQGMLSMLRGADASIGAAGRRPDGSPSDWYPTTGYQTTAPGPQQNGYQPNGYQQNGYPPNGRELDRYPSSGSSAPAAAAWSADPAYRQWQGRPSRPGRNRPPWAWQRTGWTCPSPSVPRGGASQPLPAERRGGQQPIWTGDGVRRDPPPRLTDLESLIAGLRQAGLDIDTTVVGNAPPLSPGQELVIYRIIQEALTNAMRHAPQAHVQLELTFSPEYVVVFVDDDGTAAGAGKMPNSGHGLMGMYERVAAAGGTIDAGPRQPGPGWRVHARIPVATLGAMA